VFLLCLKRFMCFKWVWGSCIRSQWFRNCGEWIIDEAIISTTDVWKYYDVKHTVATLVTQTCGPIVVYRKEVKRILKKKKTVEDCSEKLDEALWTFKLHIRHLRLSPYQLECHLPMKGNTGHFGSMNLRMCNLQENQDL
jgi:hypothetical protein